MVVALLRDLQEERLGSVVALVENDVEYAEELPPLSDAATEAAACWSEQSAVPILGGDRLG